MDQVEQKERPLQLGLAGLGTVGTGVYETLQRNHDILEARAKIPFSVKKVAVRDLDKPREVEIPSGHLTDNWRDLVQDPDIDIIIELIGGTKDAYDLIVSSLKAGKPVVTGNKALLAERGTEIFMLSAKLGVPIYFEASAGGAGVAAMAEWLIPEGKLTPITLTDQKVEEQFKTIFAELESGTVDSMLQVSLALHQLLTLCAQGLLNQEQTESNQQVIQQAAQTIREKYNQPLSLNDLLRQAHMSRSYFLRLFRRYMGTTPYNYLISTRITQAKALLALTDRSVSEIGREVGFGDASNFSARFSAAVGQSPMQYRRSALHQAEKEQE